MADIRYDLGQMFGAAFGVSSPVYMTRPVGIGSQRQELNYSGVQVISQADAEQYSWLGTPIVFPVLFKSGIYKIYNADGKLVDREFKEFQLPAATIVEFSRAKNITRTDVLGNNGTVKEIYGFDDWQIRMRGVCLPEPNRSSQEQKESLLQWEQVAAAVEIDGALFDEKSINSIAITEINFSQIQAKPEVIPFEIIAVSDEPIEFLLSQKARGVLVAGDLELTDVYE